LLKEIKGYEGIYWVSSTGYIINAKHKVLKTYINNNGYHCLKLYRQGNTQSVLLHRIVAYAFCVGYKEGLVVNHIDADRNNNKANNLEWVTTQENMLDVRDRNMLDTASARKALLDKQKTSVICMDSHGKLLKIYPSILDAENATGVTKATIIGCCMRSNNSSISKFGRYYLGGGYHWEYKNKGRKMNSTKSITLTKGSKSYFFDSIRQASKFLGINPSTLGRQLKLKHTIYKGYTLVY